MAIRCKMVCTRRTPKWHEVTLEAVTSGSDENKAFFSATPSATFDLRGVADGAVDGLVVGQEYYVDISLAPTAAAPADGGDGTAATP